MVVFSSSCILFILLIGSSTPSKNLLQSDENRVDYSGYKVIRVHPVTPRQRRFLEQYYMEEVESGVTLWTEPLTTDHSVDLQVTKKSLAGFVYKLHRQNISYDLLIDDLQRLIEEQRREVDKYLEIQQQEKRRRRRRRRSVNQTIQVKPTEQDNSRAHLPPSSSGSTEEDSTDDDEDEQQKLAELGEILNRYATYREIMQWLESVERLKSNISEVVEIGKSYNGTPMLLLKLGEAKSSPKPAIWVDGGIHAREWISPATAVFMIFTLISGHGKDPVVTKFLQDFDWFILPVMNPDGYEYTHTTDRMWRKTRSRIPANRRQCLGVDANRNFDFQWQSECASNARCRGRYPCSDVYAGKNAFSEPETIAVANFILQHRDRIKMYMSLHSYSQFWLLPWAYTRQHPADYDELVGVSRKAVNALKALYNTTYSIGSPAEILYAATGGSYDWAKGVAGIKYSFTVELRDTGSYGFLLPRSQIRPTGQEIWAAIKGTVAEIRQDTCWMNKTSC